MESSARPIEYVSGGGGGGVLASGADVVVVAVVTPTTCADKLETRVATRWPYARARPSEQFARAGDLYLALPPGTRMSDVPRRTADRRCPPADVAARAQTLRVASSRQSSEATSAAHTQLETQGEARVCAATPIVARVMGPRHGTQPASCGADTSETRLEWFSCALRKLRAQLSRLAVGRVAFAYRLGHDHDARSGCDTCAAWPRYAESIRAFADAAPFRVLIATEQPATDAPTTMRPLDVGAGKRRRVPANPNAPAPAQVRAKRPRLSAPLAAGGGIRAAKKTTIPDSQAAETGPGKENDDKDEDDDGDDDEDDPKTEWPPFPTRTESGTGTWTYAQDCWMEQRLARVVERAAAAARTSLGAVHRSLESIVRFPHRAEGDDETVRRLRRRLDALAVAAGRTLGDVEARVCHLVENGAGDRPPTGVVRKKGPLPPSPPPPPTVNRHARRATTLRAVRNAETMLPGDAKTSADVATSSSSAPSVKSATNAEAAAAHARTGPAVHKRVTDGVAATLRAVPVRRVGPAVASTPPPPPPSPTEAAATTRASTGTWRIVMHTPPVCPRPSVVPTADAPHASDLQHATSTAGVATADRRSPSPELVIARRMPGSQGKSFHKHGTAPGALPLATVFAPSHPWLSRVRKSR